MAKKSRGRRGGRMTAARKARYKITRRQGPVAKRPAGLKIMKA